MVHKGQTEPSLPTVQAGAAGVRLTELSEAAEMLDGLEEGGKTLMLGQVQDKSKPPGLQRWRYTREAPRTMMGRGKERR